MLEGVSTPNCLRYTGCTTYIWLPFSLLSRSFGHPNVYYRLVGYDDQYWRLVLGSLLLLIKYRDFHLFIYLFIYLFVCARVCVTISSRFWEQKKNIFSYFQEPWTATRKKNEFCIQKVKFFFFFCERPGTEFLKMRKPQLWLKSPTWSI